MAILALGVSHRRAGVDLLERIAFDEDDLVKAYRRVVDDPAIAEAVIVSTCNRVEVYGSVPSYHTGFRALNALLCESRGLDPDELADPLYSHYERDAAEHLFDVSGGLDSMVLGEPQIQSQVREALRRAVAEGAAGRTLTDLFHAAVRAGRRVRSETGIGAAPDAFVQAGTDLASETLGGLEGRHAVVVGAGMMSSLATTHLRSRGVATIRVLNRSIERARSLAGRVEAEPGHLDELPSALGETDLVVSATGATGAVITEAAVRAAAHERERPLFLLDLGVPRDVEPSVRGLAGVTLVDIDDLRRSLEDRAAGMTDELERARAIAADEARRFELRRRAERLAPVIRALRDRGETAVAAELERFRSDLGGLSPEQLETVTALARGVVAKLLHDPIVRVKELSGPGSPDDHARALVDLFGLELPDA
ncbi:MAG TPA: glutamyl-tRNA reductase [Actinomycetota bacterium]